MKNQPCYIILKLLHFQVSYLFQTPVFLGASDAVMELLRQNAQAFSQISSNLSAFKVFDLHIFFVLATVNR